jgi:flagella basal body P-ring formation protein FlgA
MRNLVVIAAGLLALSAGAAFADPVLKSEVDVAGNVVTVADMFADAGDLADRPLFLAPAPGTSGSVAIDDVRLAALKAGIPSFDDRGVTSVEVSRLSTPVDTDTLTRLISAELGRRGMLPGGASAVTTFERPPEGLVAAAEPEPVQLTNFQYAAETGLFSARFALAGEADPLDVTGRIDLVVDAPALAATLPAGTILKASDIVTEKVPLRMAQNGNLAAAGQLIGKQLQRQSLAGMVLKATDVADPQLIARNDLVTVYLHAGPMTLTVRGTALNAASLGQPVSVMNAASKKIVHGIARADGAVEVSAAPLSVAGL